MPVGSDLRRPHDKYHLPSMSQTSTERLRDYLAQLPPQSLALLNNPLLMRTSNAFAQHVLEESKGNMDEALLRAFDEAYSRKPYPEELEVARETLKVSADPKEGLRLFLQGMMGANNFLYSY